jgi:hypothetical protein
MRSRQAGCGLVGLLSIGEAGLLGHVAGCYPATGDGDASPLAEPLCPLVEPLLQWSSHLARWLSQTER